jgi:hypothetical protein
MRPLNYTHRDNFSKSKKDRQPLSIVKVLKKAFKKPSKNQNQKFAWLLKNSENNSKADRSIHGMRKSSKDSEIYIKYNKQQKSNDIPIYLNKPIKKKSPPVPKNTLRSQEDIIVRIENIKRSENNHQFQVSELISEPLTERNINIKSKSRDRKQKEYKSDPLDSGCLSDRSHLKKKSLFSKLSEPFHQNRELYKKVFTFKEEAFESKNINSLGSKGEVRISFAPSEEPKPIKTSILESKVIPLNQLNVEKPSFVEFSTPSNSKNDKSSFDLKLDLNSLQSRNYGAKSERYQIPKRNNQIKGLVGLDFIPERSSEHNFEGKISRLGSSISLLIL